MELTLAEQALAQELAVVLSIQHKTTGLSSTELTVLKNRIENSGSLYLEEYRIEPKALADIIRKPGFSESVMG